MKAHALSSVRNKEKTLTYTPRPGKKLGWALSIRTHRIGSSVPRHHQRLCGVLGYADTTTGHVGCGSYPSRCSRSRRGESSDHLGATAHGSHTFRCRDNICLAQARRHGVILSRDTADNDLDELGLDDEDECEDDEDLDMQEEDDDDVGALARSVVQVNTLVGVSRSPATDCLLLWRCATDMYHACVYYIPSSTCSTAPTFLQVRHLLRTVPYILLLVP